MKWGDALQIVLSVALMMAVVSFLGLGLIKMIEVLIR